jgi:hypothetical protein
MTIGGATGGVGLISTNPTDRPKTRLQQEMEAGQRRVAQHGGLSKRTSPAPSPTVAVAVPNCVDNSTPAPQPPPQFDHTTASQPQAEGITPPLAQGPPPNPLDQGPPSPPAANTGTVQEFLQRALPWPTDDEPGYINLHGMLRSPGMEGKWTGYPTRSVTAFWQKVQWCLTWQHAPDLYFCMSRQARTKSDGKGNERADRSGEHALAYKGVWADLDVKVGAYQTLDDARAALKAFCEYYKLPPPTALVVSGGGLHGHWISDRILTPDEWTPYAEGLKNAMMSYGLKCDLGVIANKAQVLRVPSTYNYKIPGNPRPVRILDLQAQDYDFATALAELPRLAGGHATPRPTATAIPGRPAASFMGAHIGSLADGINEPLDNLAIFKGCPHMREALLTGGKEFKQGLWNLTTLAATFMEDGNALAHQMAKDHPGYSHNETEALWFRKLDERQTRHLGWPGCKAFQDEGCKHCATCPNLALEKSPLHLGIVSRSTPPAQNVASQPKQGDSNPVTRLMTLRDQGASIDMLMAAINETFAVVKYGSEIRIARIVGKELNFMKLEDFHKMFANLVVEEEIKTIKGQQAAKEQKTTTEPEEQRTTTETKATRKVPISKLWFIWKRRRQYVNRGVVFEPGGPLQTENDMLNLWRGFGVEPKQGGWSLMYNHILKVICRGNQKHFDYLIKWMAYGLQHPDRPIGVTVALRGEEGAGKGLLWRNYGKLYGKHHFKHVLHGEQLTGRFNATLGDACAVFLDEAFWAGDQKAAQILKGLITEDTFQLERKFCDPIPVPNRLRIMIASNNDWIVPVGTKGRRYVVLDVSDQYSDENDPASKAYWEPLHAQFGNQAPDDGRAAMLYDLLHMDLSGFNVRAVPTSAAKTEQKLLSLRGTAAWLYSVLQEGVIVQECRGGTVKFPWGATGLTISKDDAYNSYVGFSQQRREWQPEIKDAWSKNIRKALGQCVGDTRPSGVRSFQFKPLADCRREFGSHLRDQDLEWEPDDRFTGAVVGQTAEPNGQAHQGTSPRTTGPNGTQAPTSD